MKGNPASKIFLLIIGKQVSFQVLAHSFVTITIPRVILDLLLARAIAGVMLCHSKKGGELRLLAKEKVMAFDSHNLPELVKEIRRQLSLSQEDLARELGISFASVNRWENGQVKPSKLAKAQLDNFCNKMIRRGKLKLSGGDK